MTDNLLLDAALEYLDQGFSVIPVKQSDKRPYVKWEAFQHRLPTADEIEHWWSSWPDANVAIICGEISGIFCVDADGPAGIQWMNTHLPKTGVYSVTSKGVHAIYRIPEDKRVQNAVRLAPEVDIRGSGGYFVAPPSRHACGHTYRWQFIMDGWEDLAEYQPPSTGATSTWIFQPPGRRRLMCRWRKGRATAPLRNWRANGSEPVWMRPKSRPWRAAGMKRTAALGRKRTAAHDRLDP